MPTLDISFCPLVSITAWELRWPEFSFLIRLKEKAFSSVWQPFSSRLRPLTAAVENVTKNTASDEEMSGVLRRDELAGRDSV